MSAKLLGLASGAAILVFSISAAPASAFTNTESNSGWNLTFNIDGKGTFSGIVAAVDGLSGHKAPSALRLKDWIFTYSPSFNSAVGQFTLDSSNSDVEVLYCDSCTQNTDELEVVIRICCVSV